MGVAYHNTHYKTHYLNLVPKLTPNELDYILIIII